MIIRTWPFVLGAHDYHEFSHAKDLLSFITGDEVFYAEIDTYGLDGNYQDYPVTNSSPYIAVFYTNITRDKARELLIERGIKIPPAELSRDLLHVYERPASREWLPCQACGGSGVDENDSRVRCVSSFTGLVNPKQCQLPAEHEGTHRHYDGKTWFAW